MTTAINQELNEKAFGDKTNIELYCNLIKDKFVEKINMQEPSIADKIVIAHVENELANLIKFLNQGLY